MRRLLFFAVCLLILGVSTADGDIYQWEYIDPLHPELGKQQSSTLALDGAGLMPEASLEASCRNLAHAYLAGFDLVGASFTESNLTEAYASGANLSDTDLRFANLSGVDFSHADLTSASLREADLTSANLRYADLTEAYLVSVNLVRADLSYADLSHARFLWWPVDMTEANFTGANLTGVYYLGGQYSNAVFDDAVIREAGLYDVGTSMTQDQFYSTASYKTRDLYSVSFYGGNMKNWDFTGQDLTDSRFGDVSLQGANFSDALLVNANLHNIPLDHVNFSGADLTNAEFGLLDGPGGFPTASSLIGADFHSAILRGANLSGCDLAEANFTDADIRDARLTTSGLSSAVWGFEEGRFTALQFYSTASYQRLDLTGIQLVGVISGWEFTGQNLAGATIFGSTLDGAELANVDFAGANLMGARIVLESSLVAKLSGADARGAYELQVDLAKARNFIHPDGHVEGLEIRAGETLHLWDLDPTLTPRYPDTPPIGEIPIVVEAAMSIDPAGTLRAVFEDDQWRSTINLEPGIPVSLDGTLELLLDDSVHPPSLVGKTYQLFDWTGVTPTGQFDLILTQNGLLWDTGSLYTTGHVTLIGAVPEPSTWMLLVLFSLVLAGNNPKLRTQCGM